MTEQSEPTGRAKLESALNNLLKRNEAIVPSMADHMDGIRAALALAILDSTNPNEPLKPFTVTSIRRIINGESGGE